MFRRLRDEWRWHRKQCLACGVALRKVNDWASNGVCSDACAELRIRELELANWPCIWCGCCKARPFRDHCSRHCRLADKRQRAREEANPTPCVACHELPADCRCPF